MTPGPQASGSDTDTLESSTPNSCAVSAEIAATARADVTHLFAAAERPRCSTKSSRPKATSARCSGGAGPSASSAAMASSSRFAGSAARAAPRSAKSLTTWSVATAFGGPSSTICAYDWDPIVVARSCRVAARASRTPTLACDAPRTASNAARRDGASETYRRTYSAETWPVSSKQYSVGTGVCLGKMERGTVATVSSTLRRYSASSPCKRVRSWNSARRRPASRCAPSRSNSARSAKPRTWASCGSGASRSMAARRAP
mmetsp:Transcript_29733/g.100142  ORF Transcript_29733/g.100142 Transcript_29733/m.100142 type:complete len:259 (+) Transcript_29733:918-1694(+)